MCNAIHQFEEMEVTNSGGDVGCNFFIVSVHKCGLMVSKGAGNGDDEE